MITIKHLFATVLPIICCVAMWSQDKPQSYIISKNEVYTIDLKSNKPEIVLFAEEKKWVGDTDDYYVKSNRIDYSDSFEVVSDVEAFSISPEKKKFKVKNILTADLEIANVFYHDMKYKFYRFESLTKGSETYSSYRKQYKRPQFLDKFYFRDGLDCNLSEISLRIAKNIEVGYVLHGDDTDKINFSTDKDGDYTIYKWQLKNAKKDEVIENAPQRSYYSPHLIFYIKNYTTDNGKQNVLGSIDDLYRFYYETVKDINKSDESALKEKTIQLTHGFSKDYDKAKAIFDYVQSNVNYVAFEDGMGGFIPREAADVYAKKYGDCKDMANLLNEMLTFAGIESHLAWIGTRHNDYTYDEIPTPVVDNHMIAVAKIDNSYQFLDATGRFMIFPNPTPFIQGKQTLLKIDADQYKLMEVPVIDAQKNSTSGKISYSLQNYSLKGNANLQLDGYVKTEFIAHYKSVIDKDEMLKSYFSQFISQINTSGVVVADDDINPRPLSIANEFSLEKWVKETNGQLLFKPILFFPYSDLRIDTNDRKVPYEFDYKEAFHFEYEFEIPETYSIEFKPDDFKLDTNLLSAAITYTVDSGKLMVKQDMAMNTLLLNPGDFDAWNSAIKTITKHYNQNIVLIKK